MTENKLIAACCDHAGELYAAPPTEENKGAAVALPEPDFVLDAGQSGMDAWGATKMRAFRAEGEADLHARIAAAEAEVVRLRAQRNKAVAALSALRSVCFDRRDALNEFERFGDLYYREFGRLRPGKDDPMGYSNSEENREQYNTWAQSRTEAAIDLADATLANLKEQAA